MSPQLSSLAANLRGLIAKVYGLITKILGLLGIASSPFAHQRGFLKTIRCFLKTHTSLQKAFLCFSKSLVSPRETIGRVLKTISGSQQRINRLARIGDHLLEAIRSRLQAVRSLLKANPNLLQAVSPLTET